MSMTLLFLTQPQNTPQKGDRATPRKAGVTCPPFVSLPVFSIPALNAEGLGTGSRISLTNLNLDDRLGSNSHNWIGLDFA
jgi:hypothetical protein